MQGLTVVDAIDSTSDTIQLMHHPLFIPEVLLGFCATHLNFEPIEVVIQGDTINDQEIQP